MLTTCNLSQLIPEQARIWGDKVALSYRDYATATWKDITWRQFADRVGQVSAALLRLGVGVQENIGVFTQNKPEGVCVDFGAYGIRAVTIPFYATSSEAQVQYMINDAGIRYVFVGEQYQYDTAFRVFKMCPTLEQLIIFDPQVKRDERDQVSVYLDEFLAPGADDAQLRAEAKARAAASTPDDIINILYTSGTTGVSKGVVLTQRMYAAAIPANDKIMDLRETDVIMCFLPFTHVFERAWSYWCLARGCQLAINLRPQDIQMTLTEVHPTCMAAVPRFWEKVYAGVQEKIAESSAMQRRLMLDALAVGKRYNVDYRLRGLVPPVALKLKYMFYEKTILALLKKRLGLERANFFPTAGSFIPPQIEEFVHSVGINMTAGYGMTETTATVSCDWHHSPVSIGSVGRVLEGIEISFGEQNEILLRGDTIMKQYYRKPDVTAQAYDADGWFHTGDCGYLKNGELYLTDRIKDLFKTSNGKYISPQMLESKFVVDRYIDEVAIVADERKFVSALVIPEYKLLEQWANDNGIAYASRRELCANPLAVQMLMQRIETLQQEFAHYEQVKRITLLPEPFSMERGELTNTLKIKRPVIAQNYKAEIDAMYAE
ncbi:MAG: long-chain fatty acid--CoA ligase [Bacteroidaceae bacterium]|nr:long-chain fatty acid--CoA ligase [Bacteroidaceae bacterium]